jgi:O-antigen/teichoic acid export membrane protein
VSVGVLRRAGLLLLGSVGSQGIALALAPLLTRLYGPAEFGVFGVFTAVAGIVASVASLGLEAAIVIERDPEQARFAYGLALAMAAAVALAAGAAALGASLVGWTGALPAPVLAMVPLSVLALGWGQVAVGRALALERPFAVAVGRFMRAAGVGIAQVALAALAASATALVAGAVVGQVAASVSVALLLRRTPGPRAGVAGFRAVVRRHGTLLGWSAPQTLLNNLGANAAPMVLAGCFPEAVVGDFALASRVVQVPAVTLGEAMRQSLLKSASDVSGDAAALSRLLARSTAALGAVLGAAALVGWYVAPFLFAVVFGERWRVAGTYAAWLLIGQAAGIANIPAVTAVTVCGLQRPFFLFQFVSVPVRLGALAWGAVAGDARLALAAYAVASVATSAGVTAWVGAWLRRRRIEGERVLA